jgi:transposase
MITRFTNRYILTILLFNPQILLGLLVRKNAYPLAYDIFEGNKFEGDTFIPILDKFREKFKLEKLTVIADAGLLSQKNIQDLINKKYEFIIGARIKNEKESIKQEILENYKNL